MTSLPVTAAGDTHPGMAREKNEDNLFVAQPDRTVPAAKIASHGLLYVVADGVGGNRGGARAAEITVTSIPQSYYAGDSPDSTQNLRAAFDATARQIVAEANANPERASMSCTVVAAAVVGNQAVIAHLGDARAYLLRAGRLQRLTRDDTWVQEQVDKGTLSELEADTHPDRNVITKSMGGASMPTPTLRQVQLQDGDRLLLCSDGLCGVANDADIQAVLGGTRDVGQTVAKLIALANEKGGPDNVTALVTQIGQPVIVAAAGRSRAPVLMGVIVLAALLLGAWLILQSVGPPPVAGVTPDGQATTQTIAGSEAASTVAALPGGSSGSGGVSVEATSTLALSTGLTPPPIGLLDYSNCEPGSEETVDMSASVNFRWNWSGELSNGQSLEVLAGRLKLVSLGPIPDTAKLLGGEWFLPIPADDFGEGPGVYSWQVVLIADGFETPLQHSQVGCFEIVESSGGGLSPATNTPQPSATNTPQPPTANTPEPPPANTPEPPATNTPQPPATNTPQPPATNTPQPPATNTPEPGIDD